MQTNIMVYLDDNILDSQDELLRCGHLVLTNENGEQSIVNDLFDSAGFFSRDELIGEVVSLLDVKRESVWLIE